MKRIVALSVASLLLVFARGPEGRVVTDPSTIVSPKNPAARPVPIEDLFLTRSLSGGAWSPDGKEIVFVTNLTGRSNVWKVASTGGWPVQMAVSEDRQIDPIFSPDGAWIVWGEDKGGNRVWDLWAVPSKGGAAVNLTNTPEVLERDPVFSPDSKQIACSSRPKTGGFQDLVLIDVSTRAVRKLTNETAGGSWEPLAWTEDGKWLYANRESGDHSREIFRVDVATGHAEDLTPLASAAKVQIVASSLSFDGRTLLATSDEKGGHANVALVDTGTRKLTWLTDLGWNAYSGGFSPDGSEITYTVNEDGRTDSYVAKVAGGAARKLALPGGANIRSFSPRGERILIERESSTMPNDFWVLDRKSGHLTQLSRSAPASLDPATLPESHIVHYKSFDGTLISALLLVPFNLERNGRNPAIVFAHGGPTFQTVDAFNRTVTALVTRGYTVIEPNFRGSSGYGPAFQHMSDNDRGGGDLEDEVYASKFLASTGYVDPKKIGMWGESYGGFLTLMAIGKTPDVWAAAVALYPSLGTAATYLAKARAPLLVMHGENDPGIPIQQSRQAVAILEAAGKTVQAHYYPGEGHGFTKRENQIDAARRTIVWFDRYLK